MPNIRTGECGEEEYYADALVKKLLLKKNFVVNYECVLCEISLIAMGFHIRYLHIL